MGKVTIEYCPHYHVAEISLALPNRVCYKVFEVKVLLIPINKSSNILSLCTAESRRVDRPNPY